MAKATETSTETEGRRVAELAEADFCASKLGEVRADLAACRETNKMTALASLHRLEIEMKDRHSAATTAAGQSVTGMSDAQLLDQVVRDSIALPPAIRDQFMETLDALDTGQIVPLKVSGQ